MAQISQIPAGQTIPRTEQQIADLGPATPSLDHALMSNYWQTVGDLLDGQEKIIAGGQRYLPSHPKELNTDYQFRLSNGVLTNIYADIIETLAAKPFDEELTIIEDSASSEFIGTPVKAPDGTLTGKFTGGLIEDIDGKGSHLHVFASQWFYNGINAAIDWVFVDYPKTDPNITLAEERNRNIRPYWYRVPAIDVLEVNSAMIGSKEELIYVRIHEWKRTREGFRTVTKERVREISRLRTSADNEAASYGIPQFIVWEKDDKLPGVPGNPLAQWRVVDKGVYTVGIIPMVPLIVGRRRGSSWVIDPPMKSAATLQIELYQQETGLKNVKNLVCYPMLAANGVNLKNEDGTQVEITIGPHTILSAPPGIDGGTPGNWEFLEPGAQSLEFVAKRTDVLKQELRELGRQPLTAQSGNLTVITTAFASSKANSAVQAWAIALKDALENALKITAMWMKLKIEPEVALNLDFLLDLNEGTAPTLQAMRNAGDLSQETLWEEHKRRGILGPDFTAERELGRLKEEIPSDQDLEQQRKEAIVAAGGDPNNPDA